MNIRVILRGAIEDNHSLVESNLANQSAMYFVLYTFQTTSGDIFLKSGLREVFYQMSSQHNKVTVFSNGLKDVRQKCTVYTALYLGLLVTI